MLKKTLDTFGPHMEGGMHRLLQEHMANATSHTSSSQTYSFWSLGTAKTGLLTSMISQAQWDK